MPLTTTGPTPTPRIFTDEQVQHILALTVTRYETLDLRTLCAELVALDEAQISMATAQMVTDLLTDADHGPEEEPTLLFLATILRPPTPIGMEEDPEWRTDRTLRCVSNAIALGLHIEGDGELVRVLLEDPDTVSPIEWDALVNTIDRLATAEENRTLATDAA